MRYYKLKKELGSYTIGKIYPFTLNINDDEYWQLVGISDYYRQQRNRLQIVSSGTTGTLYSDGFVLPKYWYIELTPENFDIIKEWFIKKVPFFKTLDSYDCYYIGIYKRNNLLGISTNISFFGVNSEISFEQFKKYVLDMENNSKPIAISGIETREIIGYKLKYPEYKTAINSILGYQINLNKFENDIESYPETIAKLSDAKILDIWFEPVFVINEVNLYFGDVKFTLIKGNDYADTVHGKIQMLDIKAAIDYIENPPKLGEYELHIHSTAGNHNSIKNIGEGKWNHMYIGFGCKKGTLKELKAVYHAYCELNNINK